MTSVGETLTFLALPYIFRSGRLTMLMLDCQQNLSSESGVRLPGPVPLTDAIAIRICLDPLCVRTFLTRCCAKIITALAVLAGARALTLKTHSAAFL